MRAVMCDCDQTNESLCYTTDWKLAWNKHICCMCPINGINNNNNDDVKQMFRVYKLI